MNQLINKIKNMSLLSWTLMFICISLIIIIIPILQYNILLQELNYNLLVQNHDDQEQLIKDHPDRWWYKTDLNTTNQLLEDYRTTK